jgi:hypothetical protein
MPWIPLFTFVWALALNGSYSVVDIVTCDSHEMRNFNFSNPVNQIFHEALTAASTNQSSVSND